MTIRTLIVDDEPVARRGLRDLLKGIPDFEVVGECEDARQFLHALAGGPIDLVFLDIRMPGENGIEALSAAEGDLPLVVFVTAYDRYAVRAFEAHAIDYVLKPVARGRLEQACERVREAIDTRRVAEYGRRVREALEALADPSLPGADADIEGAFARSPRFVVKTHGKVRVVRGRDIRWVAATGDYVRLYTDGESFLLRQTLRSIADQLADCGLVRIHRSTAASLDAIEELRVGPGGRLEAVLPEGVVRAVSKSGKKRLEAALRTTL
jgi:two-component system LytT family response regulator